MLQQILDTNMKIFCAIMIWKGKVSYRITVEEVDNCTGRKALYLCLQRPDFNLMVSFSDAKVWNQNIDKKFLLKYYLKNYLYLLQHRTFRDFLGVVSNDLFISGDDLEDVDDDTEELVFHLLLL